MAKESKTEENNTQPSEPFDFFSSNLVSRVCDRSHMVSGIDVIELERVRGDNLITGGNIAVFLFLPKFSKFCTRIRLTRFRVRMGSVQAIDETLEFG